MKTPILLIAFICSSYSSLFAQEYTPFPLKDARWNTYHFSFYEIKNSVYFGGDTIINQRNYSKLYYNSAQRAIFNPNTWMYSDSNLTGYIREDKKIVYFLSGGKESVLFDFNLKTGDSIYFPNHPDNSNQDFFVSVIDSVQLLDGTFRKRFTVKRKFFDNQQYQIIEGIGGLVLFHDLIPKISTTVDGEFYLTCFIRDGKLLYSDKSQQGDCSFISNNKEILNLPIRLSSNVLSSSIEVSWQGSPLNFALYNTFGQLICRFEAQTAPFTLEKGNQPSGIYFLKIENENHQFQTHKIIVE